MTNYNYITNFHKSRESKIGASDIPCLIPNPNNSIESLASFTKDGKRIVKTAIDLYDEKINGKEYEYSFAADMGHFLEVKVLYEFIKDNISIDIAKEFYRGYMMHDLETKLVGDCVNPIPYNKTPFKHNTEVTNEYGVAHADVCYDPKENVYNGKKFDASKFEGQIINKNGLSVNLSKPFLIEAKSANYFSAKRKDDVYKGYDLELKEWQGTPLSHYMQIQYQLMLYDIDVCYLALIYNTNEKHYWTIKANKKHQAELKTLATYMKKSIDTKTPPKQLAMNQSDIINLYPTIKEDFQEIQGEQLEDVINSAMTYHRATSQEKLWKGRAEEARQAMSVHLKDTSVIKGIVDGQMTDLCKWKVTKSTDRLCGLGSIKKREEKESKRIMNYAKRNKMINTTEESRKATVCIKKIDLEGFEI